MPLTFIRTNADIFSRVGSVVATYRTRGNTRFGPYYRLIYRVDRRQRSLYLGRDEDLADQVRQLLNELQKRLATTASPAAVTSAAEKQNSSKSNVNGSKPPATSASNPTAGTSAAGEPKATPASPRPPPRALFHTNPKRKRGQHTPHHPPPPETAKTTHLMPNSPTSQRTPRVPCPRDMTHTNRARIRPTVRHHTRLRRGHAHLRPIATYPPWVPCPRDMTHTNRARIRPTVTYPTRLRRGHAHRLLEPTYTPTIPPNFTRNRCISPQRPFTIGAQQTKARPPPHQPEAQARTDRPPSALSSEHFAIKRDCSGRRPTRAWLSRGDSLKSPLKVTGNRNRSTQIDPTRNRIIHGCRSPENHLSASAFSS